MFLDTYRGITPILICGSENLGTVHEHFLVNSLIKINGGFEILSKQKNYHFEYRKRVFEEIKLQPPVIMLPSREQDYMDDYFSSVFPKAARLLQESRVLVIIGYSLPEEDSLLRFLLRQFAEDPCDSMDMFIFYIDHMGATKQEKKLNDCFHYMWQQHRGNIFTYSGGLTNWIRQIRKTVGKNYRKQYL